MSSFMSEEKKNTLAVLVRQVELLDVISHELS
jgi:hypothetical protein